MNIDQQVIDLATRIQRRHDFSSHVTGFLCGAVILGALLIAGIKGRSVPRRSADLGDCPVVPALPAGPARPGHNRRGPR